MPQAPYIPSRDADYDNWLTNFSALITAEPTDFGLVADDATAIASARTAYHNAFVTATNPATRTSATVAAKDAARASSEATVRPYAQAISRNAAVTNENKTAVGVNLPNPTATPIPAPTDAPALEFRKATPLVHELGYSVAGATDGKAKPYGADRLDLHVAIGTNAAVDPSQATYRASWTKSPNRVTFSAEDIGKKATYFARFATKSGPGGAAQFGPWSAALVITIV